MVRVRQRWNNRDRVRSTDELASALGANVWKIAAAAVLELENEDYQIDTYSQRLDVIAEFCAFQVHVVDRLMHARQADGRAAFITALARQLADLMQDNRGECEGPGEHARQLIDTLNARSNDYAACAFSPQDGPSFVMRRNFGDRVARVVGEHNRRWVTDYVMEVQAPAALAGLRKAMPSLFV